MNDIELKRKYQRNRDAAAAATHRLRCVHSINRHQRRVYWQPCDVLKRMPDGRRLKVRVYGARYWANTTHIVHVRYVPACRVQPMPPNTQ